MRLPDTSIPPIGLRRLWPTETSGVGTLAWTRATGGVLRPVDRASLVAQLLSMPLYEASRRLRYAFGPKPPVLDLDDVVLPDTPASRRAEDVCGELSTPSTRNHSYRSYLWAAILAARDRIDYDEEALFVGCLLHDVGWEHPVEGKCFTLAGAEHALAAGAHGGWGTKRAEAVAEAITLHLNLVVPMRDGPIAHLLTAGTRLDASGVRLREIPSPMFDAVVSRHPRLNMKQNFVRCVSAQAEAAPGSRAYFHSRYLGAGFFMQRAPFTE